MIRKEFVLENDLGLHSRAAAIFVQLTNRYLSQIDIIKGTTKIDGKSIMGILCLGIAKNESIIVEADGVDEEEVIQKIENLIMNEL